MNINAIESAYSTYQNSSIVGKNNSSKKSDSTSSATQTETAATYDKTTDSSNQTSSTNQIYQNNKMSSADRANIIAQLKSDNEQRMESMKSLVSSMFEKQGITIGTADDMWKVLASGNFTADASTIAQAKEDISENGYWGVSQTSDRIISFAIALSGGDDEKMQKMVKAVEKGFKQATKTWGKQLPDISSQTYDAVMTKFDDWFKNNNSNATTEDILKSN